MEDEFEEDEERDPPSSWGSLIVNVDDDAHWINVSIILLRSNSFHCEEKKVDERDD